MPPLSPAQRWALVLVATSTMAVSYVDRQAVAALAPTITKDLAISDASYGLLGSAFSMAYLVFAPLSGRLVDRVGARLGLLVAVLAWSVVAGAHALVPGFASLFVLRILLGVTEAPSFPGAATTVSRALPPESRGAGFGVLFTGSSVGAAVSGWLAPTLEARWGWRGALFATAVVGLSWVPLWLAVSSRPAARAALAPAPRGEEPSVAWGELLRTPAVLRAVAAVLATAPAMGLVMQFGSKLLVAQHGLSQTEVREWLWLPPLALDVGAVGMGALASWRLRRGGQGPPRLLLAISAAPATSVALLAWSRSPAASTAAFSLALAGGGGVYALVTADMLGRVPARAVGTAGGLTAAAQSLALIVGLPLVGWSVDRSGGYTQAALALGAWVVPGSLVWLLWISGASSGTPRRA